MFRAHYKSLPQNMNFPNPVAWQLQATNPGPPMTDPHINSRLHQVMMNPAMMNTSRMQTQLPFLTDMSLRSISSVGVNEGKHGLLEIFPLTNVEQFG